MEPDRATLFAVAWTRSLTGETGFVGAINETHWQPVSTLSEAERLSRGEAEEVVALLSGHVATYAHLVPVDA